MPHVFCERMPESALTKEDQLRQGFLFDGADPPFRIGIQIGRSGREWDTVDASVIDNVLKCRTVFAVSIVEEILPWHQEAPLRHGDIACDLLHPPLIRM